jgi:hypothetical protein
MNDNEQDLTERLLSPREGNPDHFVIIKGSLRNQLTSLPFIALLCITLLSILLNITLSAKAFNKNWYDDREPELISTMSGKSAYSK